MAVSYKWTIKTLYTKNITDSGKTYNNVVKRVFGLLTATSSETGNSLDHGYDLDLKNPADWGNFVAYESLTESQVQGWIESRLTSESIADIKKFMENGLEYEDEIHGSTAQGSGSGDDFVASFPWS